MCVIRVLLVTGYTALSNKDRWIAYPGEDEVKLSGEVYVLPLPTLVERVRKMARYFGP